MVGRISVRRGARSKHLRSSDGDGLGAPAPETRAAINGELRGPHAPIVPVVKRAAREGRRDAAPPPRDYRHADGRSGVCRASP
jgi:hypothetical protein